MPSIPNSFGTESVPIVSGEYHGEPYTNCCPGSGTWQHYRNQGWTCLTFWWAGITAAWLLTLLIMATYNLANGEIENLEPVVFIGFDSGALALALVGLGFAIKSTCTTSANIRDHSIRASKNRHVGTVAYYVTILLFYSVAIALTIVFNDRFNRDQVNEEGITILQK